MKHYGVLVAILMPWMAMGSDGSVELRLGSDNYWAQDAGGVVLWTVEPLGLSYDTNQFGGTFVFYPTNSVAGRYTVTATASLFPAATCDFTVDITWIDLQPKGTNVLLTTQGEVVLKLPRPVGYIAPNDHIDWTIPLSSPGGSLFIARTNDAEFVFVPTNSVPGEYIIRAQSHEVPDAYEECSVMIVAVEINDVDNQFAPSKENLDIDYAIKSAGSIVTLAKAEVFTGETDTGIPIYEANILQSPSYGRYTGEWDGKDTGGAWVTPTNSTVKITIGMDDGSTMSVTTNTAVKVHSIELNATNAYNIVTNAVAFQEEAYATVKLMKKDGTGVETEVPMAVHFSFTEGAGNVAKTDSYQYSSGNFLGKKGDANALYWATHPKSVSAASSDGFKTTAQSKTVTTANSPDIGRAYINFLPSAVGGDKFTLNAEVREGGVTNQATSDEMTIWRSVAFDNIYEMDSEPHISSNATKADIQPYYSATSATYVEYECDVSNVIDISVDNSVEYIGLWESTQSDNQYDWALLCAKRTNVNHRIQFGPYAGTNVTTEVPTPQELISATYSNGTVQAQARVAITSKAQAWVERIDTAFLASMNAWIAANSIAANALVAIKYYHPKYSIGGTPSGITSEWPNWARVTTYRGNYSNIPPDERWAPGNGNFQGLSHANGIVSVPKGIDAARMRVVVSHEAGHATKYHFKRQDFGPNLDHSTTSGLMDPTASQSQFNEREQKTLKGIKVAP